MKALVYILLLFSALNLWGQDISSKIEPVTVLIGEPVIYEIKIVCDKNSQINYKPFESEINGFYKNTNSTLNTDKEITLELIGDFKDTLTHLTDKDVWIGYYTLTAWDSGTIVLPEDKIFIDDSMFYIPTVAFRSDLVKKIKDQGIYDIKESFADVPEKTPFILRWLYSYWWILILLFFVVFIIYRYRRNSKEPIEVNQHPEIPLKDRTLLAITSLEKQKLWEQGKLKLHFVELSYIMRSYLSARYDLNLLEKTTIETKLLLRNEGLHAETIATLMSILSQSDMVKFAQSKPDEMAILKISILAKQIVAETSPIEFDNV